MRKLSLVTVVALVVVSGTARADEGLPSQDQLAAMGLSGLQVVSDSEALDVRGQGWGGWGGSWRQGWTKYRKWFAAYRRHFERFSKSLHRVKPHRPPKDRPKTHGSAKPWKPGKSWKPHSPNMVWGGSKTRR